MSNVPEGADTFSLKGFVTIGPLANNLRHEVAALGELSLNSATYAKDRAIYSTTTTTNNPTGLDVVVFSSRTLDNPHYDVPAPYVALLTEVARWSHGKATSGVLTNDSEIYRQQFNADFDGRCSDVVVGQMVSENGIWLPESVSFYIMPSTLGATFTADELEDLERSRIKLWFADEAFSTQYDEFAIEFIAPVATDRLDDFFLVSDLVEQKVAERTVPELMNIIHNVKAGNPETKIRTISFNYHDPLDRNYRLPTNWTFVIYGAAGDNIDSIKDGLSRWILENSTHTREEWAQIFPDIFTSTEFILTPLWNQFAVPNMTLTTGLYSPTVNHSKASIIARRTSTGLSYTDEHVNKVLTSIGFPYKSLALLVVGGPENRDEVDRFEEQWPDYVSSPTSSTDFNRMQLATQNWVRLINDMLLVAEEMTQFSELPQNMTRLFRTNAQNESMMYVVANYENVQYLVLSRQSMQTYFPPTNVDALQVTVEGAVGVVAMTSANVSEGAYSTYFEAVGGKAPYLYELVEVSDQNKLGNAQIDPVSGDFTALAVAPGDITVTIKVTDDTMTEATRTFTLHLYTD